MRKNINQVRLQGRLYQHNLVIKQVQNQASPNVGKDFISGEIEIATDEQGLNIVPVHFTFVTAETKNGTTSPTFTVLKSIIDGAATWTKDGKDAALKLKVDTALALNDFYANDGQLVSTKRNEGGFVTVVTNLCDEKERNVFTADIIITNISHVDADPAKNIIEHTAIHGAIFDFKNAILPMDFTVENPAGMKYFESLEVTGSEPCYTKIWGKIKCETIVASTTEESAFGEAAVRTYERKNKSWVVTGAATEAYEFGAENVITTEELQKAIQDRNTYLASVKQRADEYKASKAAPAAAPSAPAKQGGFSF